jgi:UDP-3-O-acyl-N-acetylglucosamine deacetylase
VDGRALFTGGASSVIIHPRRDGPALAPGWGLAVVCSDPADAMALPPTPGFPAIVSNVVNEAGGALGGRRTTLSPSPTDPGTSGVQTVEHVLSALAGLGITDAVIEVRARQPREVPIADGSADPFVRAVLDAGVETVAGNARPLIVERTLEVADPHDASVRIVAEPLRPGDRPGLHARYELEYQAARTGIDLRQTFEFCCAIDRSTADGYARDVAPARTFCTFAEAEQMRNLGLFLHLTPRDMLVLGPGGVPIENTLRFADEPARHKVLDMIGDLALAGRPIVGRVTATKTGHAHNHQMARALLAAHGG